MKIDKEQLRDAYAKLPENIQQVFDADETSTALINIGKKYALHIDQVGMLTSLVHYVLLGFLPPQNFVRELKNMTGVAEDVANLITYDLNQQILMKIRRDLEELSQVQDEPARGPASGNLRTVFEPAKAEAVMPTVGQAPQPNPSTPQIFNDKMTNVANVPKQGVAIRDPYKESI